MAKLNVYKYNHGTIEFCLKLNMKPIWILIHFYLNYKTVIYFVNQI